MQNPKWYTYRHLNSHEILNKLNLTLSSKIDALEIAEKLEIPVFWNDNIESGSKLYMNLQKKHVEIHIKKGTHVYDFRYWTAHQIGHIILHEFEELIHEDAYNKPINLKDREAKSFASRLLIPTEQLLFFKQLACGQFRHAHLQELSEIFRVSKDLMKFRVINLGWYEP